MPRKLIQIAAAGLEGGGAVLWGVADDGTAWELVDLTSLSGSTPSPRWKQPPTLPSDQTAEG